MGFYRCDCGCEDCRVCGEHIKDIDARKQSKIKKTVKKQQTMIMPFGKYKGSRVNELSEAYVYRLLQKVPIKNNELKLALNAHIKEYDPCRTVDVYEDEETSDPLYNDFDDPTDFF